MSATPLVPGGGLGPLQHCLEEEIAALETFIGALNEEQAALREANADALSASTESKLQRMHELNGHTAARNAALAGAGLPPDRDGLARAREASLAAHIDRLIGLASEAAEINRINGRLIATQLQGTQDALHALGLGRRDAGGGLYAADARTFEATPRTGVRIIDSA